MDASALREKMKEKARRLAGGGDAQSVDSSDYTPPKGNPDTNIKVGMKPISRRAFKDGGKVGGEDAEVMKSAKKGMTHGSSCTCPKCSGGRVQRKSGGNVATEIANTDQKAANDDRPGKTQVGGYARGGYSKTAVDKEIAKDKTIKPKQAAMINALLKGRQKTDEPDGDDTMKRGGRAAKAGGGLSLPLGLSAAKKLSPAMALMGKKSGGRAAKAGGGTLTMDKPLKMAGTLKSDAPMSTSGTMATDAPMARVKPLQDQVTDAAMEQRANDELAAVRAAGDETRRKKGGRVARKDGGSVKKGQTNINIVSAPAAKTANEGTMPPAPPPPPLPRPPMAPPIAGPSPAMAPPPGLGAPPPMPPGPPPMMGRKSGGAVKYPFMKAGAGSGEGRLQKIREYGDKA